jgi:predicted O-methyltransferase YrrM
MDLSERNPFSSNQRECLKAGMDCFDSGNVEEVVMRNRLCFSKIAVVFLNLFLLTGQGLSQITKDPFEGIDDPRVLPMLKHLSYEHGGMNVPASDGRLLHDLIIEKGYKRGLEIGTSNGYSSLWLGVAFQKTGGKLITIEIEPKRAQEAQENFRKAGLDDVIDSRINDAFREIPRIQGTFDFVFIDAWKPDYIKFLSLLNSRVATGGAITAHNVKSHSAAMQDFLKAIHTDPTLETTIHRSSRAGVSVSFKKSN